MFIPILHDGKWITYFVNQDEEDKVYVLSNGVDMDICTDMWKATATSVQNNMHPVTHKLKKRSIRLDKDAILVPFEAVETPANSMLTTMSFLATYNHNDGSFEHIKGEEVSVLRPDSPSASC